MPHTWRTVTPRNATACIKRRFFQRAAVRLEFTPTAGPLPGPPHVAEYSAVAPPLPVALCVEGVDRTGPVPEPQSRHPSIPALPAALERPRPGPGRGLAQASRAARVALGTCHICGR
ncbi:hypothetical protein GCM10023335_49870 [Streptomyces siamensis]|uniref:Uncharacterized protein n=1 Tax=Streptomyces siamensis TaxID=1274986 RepID=A0ABP9J6L2_9ACTN